jgi:hypothetical protein
MTIVPTENTQADEKEDEKAIQAIEPRFIFRQDETMKNNRNGLQDFHVFMLTQTEFQSIAISLTKCCRTGHSNLQCPRLIYTVEYRFSVSLR